VPFADATKAKYRRVAANKEKLDAYRASGRQVGGRENDLHTCQVRDGGTSPSPPGLADIQARRKLL
jgi:hypothetical protein